jgi:hypothetical protein
MKHKSDYFIPSLSDVMFAALILLIFFSGYLLLRDCDTGYHIRAGEYILETFSVPKHDLFSFFAPELAWTAHEWFSEIIMALVHNHLGLTGVVAFFSFVLALTYYISFKSLRSHKGNLWLLLGIIFLVISSSTFHWLARPHASTLLLFVIWYHLLDRFQYQDKHYSLFWFPPIMLLWVNLHGGYIIGFVLLGIYFLGNALFCYKDQSEERKKYLNKCKILFLIGTACLLVSLINPYGYHILLFPFNLVSDKFLMSVVSEFMPTNLQEFHPYKYYLILTLAVLMISRMRVNFIELVLILLFIYMSLYSVRYITLFAFIAAPILLKRLDAWFSESDHKIIKFLNQRSDSIAESDIRSRGYFWPALATLTIFLLTITGAVEHYFDPNKKPVAAVKFLKDEHIPGNMFNNDEFGDYLIYSAYPQYRVFMDGRSDMYGVDHVSQYIKVRGLGAGWEKVLEEHDINWIFFDADSLLSRYLLERGDWHLIYADKVAHIYVRDIPEYEYLIEKYPDVEPVVYEDQ